MSAASRLFSAYAQFIVAKRIWVIGLVLLATVGLVSRVGQLQLDSDPKLWAPQKHPYVETTNLLEQVFGGKNVIQIGIVPKQGDVYQPKVLAKIKRIQDQIELIPHAVRRNILSFAAHKVKSIKGSADGMEVRPIMESVPQTPEDIEKLKAAVASMPFYVNALVSPDGKAAAIIADFKQNETVPNWAAMLDAAHKIIDSERDDTVDFYLGGSPAIGEAADKQFMKMPLFFGGALLVIMAIQFWSFRSFQGMLLPMITGILSVAWSLGAMGLLRVHLDPLNTTTPILILAVAAGHAIQILKRYYEEFHRQQAAAMDRRAANRAAVIESVVRVGPVMVTAGLIATLMFFSLVGTGIPMVQHFGVFAGFGVLATMILEMTLIPALRASLRPPKAIETVREQQAGILDSLLTRLADSLVGGRAPWFIGVGLVLLVAVGIGLAFIHVDNNFKLYHRPDSQLRIDDRVLNNTFGGTNSILFLVQTPTQDALKDPKVLQGVADLQSFLESQPNVGKTQSIADLIRRMNQAMHGDDPKYYAIPESRELVAQYLFLYSTSGDPQDFDSLVDNDYRRAAIWTYLKDDSTAYADSVAKKAAVFAAAHMPPGVSVQMGGTLPEAIALNAVVVQDKTRNMAQMGIIVFVLGAVVFRSLLGGLFVVAPLVAVIVANFGLMGWLHTPIDIAAVTSAAMAIGVGADYEIYLLFRFREELQRTGDLIAATRSSLLTSGKAILFVALSVIGGFAVLQASDFAFYNQISNMVMATMAISAFFALFFLRALMMLFKPRFIFGEQPEKFFAPGVASQAGGNR